MLKDKAFNQSLRRTPRNSCGIYSRFKTRSRRLKSSLSSTYYSCDIVEFGEGGMKVKFSEPVVSSGEILVVDVPVFGREFSVPYPTQVCWVRADGSGGGEAGLRFWAWG